MNPWQQFYKLPWSERMARVEQATDLSADQLAQVTAAYDPIGEQQVENYLYNYGVPTGLLLNLPVNGEKVTLPMTTEEPSVIAAANNGARMFRFGAGVQTEMVERLLRGQVVVTDLADPAAFVAKLDSEHLLMQANAARPSMVKRGGGAKRIEPEIIDQETVIVNLLVDPKAAMGANVVNTMAEAVANELRAQGYDVLMAILSNLATEALVTAKVTVPFEALATRDGMTGMQVAEKIAQASLLEQKSPHRAATANKGIMNGVEAVVLASGNDTRAINAAFHAYAVKDGAYRGLVQWTVTDTGLQGQTKLPIMLGVVGGSIGIVPLAQVNHTLMQQPTAEQLTDAVAGVALAQNLAALRALVTTGIQSGHMALQAKTLALQVGAGLAEVPALTKMLTKLKQFDEATARQLLEQLRSQPD